MKRLAIYWTVLTLGFLAFALVIIRKQTVTIYLPDAVQGSQPFCISNRSLFNVAIANGPTLKSGQFVAVSEVRDFAWGFTAPETATDRADVDCYVIGER